MFLFLVAVVLLGAMCGPFILRVLQRPARQRSQLRVPVDSEKSRYRDEGFPPRSDDEFLQQQCAESQNNDAAIVPSPHLRDGYIGSETNGYTITHHDHFIAQLPPPTISYAEMEDVPMESPSLNRSQRKIRVFRPEGGEVRTVVEESSMLANGGRWKRRMVVFGSGAEEDQNNYRGIQGVSELPVDVSGR